MNGFDATLILREVDLVMGQLEVTVRLIYMLCATRLAEAMLVKVYN